MFDFSAREFGGFDRVVPKAPAQPGETPEQIAARLGVGLSPDVKVTLGIKPRVYGIDPLGPPLGWKEQGEAAKRATARQEKFRRADEKATLAKPAGQAGPRRAAPPRERDEMAQARARHLAELVAKGLQRDALAADMGFTLQQLRNFAHYHNVALPKGRPGNRAGGPRADTARLARVKAAAAAIMAGGAVLMIAPLVAALPDIKERTLRRDVVRLALPVVADEAARIRGAQRAAARRVKDSAARHAAALDDLRAGALLADVAARHGMGPEWLRRLAVRHKVVPSGREANYEKGGDLAGPAVARVKAGESATAVAASLGVSRFRVSRWVAKASTEGVAQRRVRLRREAVAEARAQGRTMAQIATALGVGLSTVNADLAAMRGGGATVPDPAGVRQAAAVDRVRAGETMTAVAASLGVAELTVSRWCVRAGVVDLRGQRAAERRVAVAQARAQGLTVAQVAEGLGVAVSTVNDDLAALRKGGGDDAR